MARSASESTPPPSALIAALRAALRFDPALVSWRAGVQTALPVVLLLGGGLAAGNRVAGVTMGAGAMLVGVGLRTMAGRLPLTLLVIDALLMAVATFVGCVTGSVAAVHLIVLCLLSLLAGLLAALGRGGSVLGTQAIIAAVVFGRFSEPAPAALGLAAYVLAGGLVQTLFLRLAGQPLPLRTQRTATAAAYAELARLATGSPQLSTLPAASALDEARAAVSSGALLADPALTTLRVLVNEGHRMRIQLSALQALVSREDLGAEMRDPAGEILLAAGALLDLAAGAIGGDAAAAAGLDAAVERVQAAIDATTATVPDGLRRRLAGLAGQLRAVATLAPAAGSGSGLRGRRPQAPARQLRARVRADVELLRANITFESPAARHGLRLAIVVPLAELLSRQLPVQRSYWMVVAAATVLRPEFAATFTRGAERALGTVLGVGVAGAVATLLHPSGAATVVLVGAFGTIGYATFPASFAFGFGFITALVVFLLNAINPDTGSIAGARLLDTSIGGALGLAVYALWPTWSGGSARRALAALVRAQRSYIAALLAAVAGGDRGREDEFRGLARRARLARSGAEAAIDHSLADPARHRLDRGWSQSVLAATRRLVQSAHLLRLELQDRPDAPPLTELAPLTARLDELLAMVGGRLEHPSGSGPRSPLVPDLRAAYGALAASPAAARAGPLIAELDEIVDAAGGLAALVGLDPADPADPADSAGGTVSREA